MAAFERHRQNSQKELGDGCGRLMWLAWGGDEGIEWAQRKLKQIDNKEFAAEPGLVHPNCKCAVKKGKFTTDGSPCDKCKEAKTNWEIIGAFQNVFGDWYSKDVFGEKASIGFKAVEDRRLLNLITFIILPEPTLYL